MEGASHRFNAWVKDYVRVWGSNAPEDIGGLFSEDAEYFTAPWREPWRGRKAIVEGWLDRKDEPGTWMFEFEVAAIDGNLGVVSGVTNYDDPDPNYVNLWLITLEDAGRCTIFVEYWMEVK